MRTIPKQSAVPEIGWMPTAVVSVMSVVLAFTVIQINAGIASARTQPQQLTINQSAETSAETRLHPHTGMLSYFTVR